MEQASNKEPVKKSAEKDSKRGYYIIGFLVLFSIIAISFILGASLQRKRDLSAGRQMSSGGGNFSSYRFGSPNNRIFRHKGLRYYKNYTINGQITKISGDQITIILPNGETREITASNNTTLTKIDPANLSNLQTGQMISVTDINSNGSSASAQNIQIITAPTAAK